ncbi:MAG: DUF3102 domain-containing protein [Rhodoferax sp.]|nr:DUF3102 domain-containing protein [Rhodoferax sp.]
MNTNQITVDLAKQINALHTQAKIHATNAVRLATKAGELLLKVKSELPHGQFTTWLAENCSVSERQAQRYMAGAQGKARLQVPVVKTDMMSDLPDATKTDTVTVFPVATESTLPQLTSEITINESEAKAKPT